MDDTVSELDSAILLTERALIGGVLIDRCQTIPPIMPSEFYGDRHAQIWEAIREFAEGTTLPELAAQLAKRDQLDAVGGPAYLAQCVEDGWLVIPPLMARYAELIREAWRQRVVRALGAEIARQGGDPAQIARRVAEIPGSLTDIEPWSAWATWREYRTGVVRLPPLSTGLTQLDAQLSGLLPGEVVVLGGRTSAGKTALALHLAVVAAGRGVPTLFLSLEETTALVTMRLIAARSGVPYRRLASGLPLSDEEQQEVETALWWLEGLPLSVLSLETLKSLGEDTVCGAVAASTAPVVIVDHLQKIATAGESRQYGIERVMGRLHTAALRDQRVVVVCAQLNRESEHEKRAPRLSDLRDSGSIEILARKVLLLYWPFKIDATRDRHEYQITVAKQSTGGTGVVTVRFRAETGAFWDDPTPKGVPA